MNESFLIQSYNLYTLTTMKNIIYFSAFTLMLAATCVSFTACGGDDAEEDGDNTDKLKIQTITVNGVSFKMIVV